MSIFKGEYLLADKKSDNIQILTQNIKVELIVYQEGLFIDEDNPPEVSYNLIISDNHKLFNASLGMHNNPYPNSYAVYNYNGNTWTYQGSSSVNKSINPISYKIENVYKLSNSKFIIRNQRTDSIMQEGCLFFIDLKAKKLIGYVEDTFKTLSFSEEMTLEDFENLLKKRNLAEKLKQ